MSQNQQAFVVFPFEEPFTKVYAEVIQPTLEDLGYETNKADSLDTHRNILEDIIKGISGADIIIADLTNSNPNVFYEVGVAHGLGIPTVLITQDLDEIPFDLTAYEVFEYSTDFVEIDNLKDSLRDIANKHSNGEVTFESPVSDWTDIDINQSVSTKSEESNSDNQDPEPNKGILDYALEATESRSDLETAMHKIESDSNELESEIRKLTPDSQAEADISPKKANRLARNLATEINSYTSSVEDNVGVIDENLQFMMTALQQFIDFSDSSNPEHRSTLEEQKEDLIIFITESEEVIEETEEFKSEVKSLKGLNRNLTQACTNLSSVISDLINSLKEANAKADRLVSLIDQEL